MSDENAYSLDYIFIEYSTLNYNLIKN